jgi:hypothetical protein
MHQVTVMKLEEHPSRNQRASTATLPSHANSPTCIERLQQEIARLLIKNQTIRFELLTAQQTIAHIEQELFGPGAGEIDKLLPPDRVRYLRDLCQADETAMRIIS